MKAAGFCFALFIFCAVFFGGGAGGRAVAFSSDGELRWNARIVECIEKEMPKGGAYSTSSAASEGLRASVRDTQEGLEVRPFRAATFCSAATYTLLLKVVAPALGQMLGRGRLVPLQQADGEGVWGRWNANGPGGAVLFAETGAGINFTDWEKARAGDFLKVWWTDAVGHQERGHLVVFLKKDAESVTFWSGNKPGGYGEKTVSLSKIKRALFSRLTDPEKLAVAPLAEKNEYLGAMLKRASSWEEVLKKTAVLRGE